MVVSILGILLTINEHIYIYINYAQLLSSEYEPSKELHVA